MNQTQQWLAIQTARLDSQLSLASQQVARAQTMADVVRASRVSIPVELRGIRNSLPGVRRLNSDVSRRLEVLLHEQLEQLKACESVDACKNLRGQYLSREWQSLRGEHAALYTQADRLSHEILWRKQQKRSET